MDFAQKLKQLSPEKRSLLEQKLRRAAATEEQEPVIQRRGPKDPRVLSFGQQQLWLVDQLSPGGSAYNVPYPVRIRGPLNPEALQRAINAVVGRHEVLRTLFVNFKGQPFPVVDKRTSVDFKQIDLSQLSHEEQTEALMSALKEDAARPFSLSRDLKLRASLYRLVPEEYLLLHVAHHISWDLRSKSIFYEELAPLYQAFSAGQTCVLSELPIQYADYALWQRKYLQGRALDNLQNYWRKQLTGTPLRLDLPTDRPRPAVQGLRGAKYPVTLSEKLLEAANRVARSHSATLFNVLLAAFDIFLFATTSQLDICVGSPFAGRRKETQAIIGMFINTLVLRTRVSADLTFGEAIGRVRASTLEAISHQDLPFEKIVEAVNPPRDLSRNALFQVNFRLQNSAPAKLELPGLETEALDLVDNDSAKFDLALELPSSPKSRGYFEYNTDLFEQRTIARMADDFQTLLAELLENPDVKLTDLNSVRKAKRT